MAYYCENCGEREKFYEHGEIEEQSWCIRECTRFIDEEGNSEDWEYGDIIRDGDSDGGDFTEDGTVYCGNCHMEVQDWDPGDIPNEDEESLPKGKITKLKEKMLGGK